MAEVFELEIHDRIAHLVFDDGHYNIFDLDRARTLLGIIKDLDGRQEVKALILEGNSKTLSAGVDLAAMRSGGVVRDELLATMRDILATLYASRLRIVSICTGHAVAAGAMLLLVSDHRIGVSGNVKIGFTEVAYGLPLPRLSVLLIKDRLSADQQFAATVLSRMYSSENAVSAGFLDELVPGLQLARDRAAKVARELAELDDTAYLETLLHVRGDTLDQLRNIPTQDSGSSGYTGH